MLEALRMPCQSMVLFSSTSSVWSQSGASHYAAANTFLDVFAVQRQSTGMHAVAMQYGPFAQVGMAANHAKALTKIGLHPHKPHEVNMLTHQKFATMRS